MALFVARNAFCEHANEASVTGPRDEDLYSQNQDLLKVYYTVFQTFLIMVNFSTVKCVN